MIKLPLKSHVFKTEIKDIANVSALDTMSLIDKFNYFGFILIDNPIEIDDNSCQFREFLLGLSRYFGKIVFHEHSDQDGIVKVKIKEGCSKYINTTSNAILSHTDGSFLPTPPKVIALQAKIVADQGGVTSLVDAKKIYDYLADEYCQLLPSLFTWNAMTINRNGKQASHPIFKDNGSQTYMIFRGDNIANIKIKPDVLPGFRLIQKFISNPYHQLKIKLQPNQILVCDNTRILHGRTSFKKQYKRELNRIWFDGYGKANLSIQYGFRRADNSF